MQRVRPATRAMCAFLVILMSGTGLFGADGIVDTVGKESASSSQSDEIAALKAALTAQQKQLESMQRTMAQQQKLLDKVAESASAPALRPNLGSVASIAPVLPVPARAMAPALFPAAQAAAATASAPKNPCDAGPDTTVPPYLRLGSVCIVPVGFMDLTGVWRDKNAASSLGSNFGSVPFSNAVNGNLSEFRFTPQNSRLGVRVDGDWKGTHFIGYNEFDFLGTSGQTNLTTTNGAFVPRLRLFWVDVRKDKYEFLAGQSWSLITPNRKGMSALPSDLFYSQVIDVNYMAGLTWTRQPGMRFIYHPNDKLAFGFSAENPNQYIGGSAGGSGITLPTAYAALGGTQLDNSQNISLGNQVLNAPTVAPDFIAKVTYDPSSKLHLELAGIERTFKIVNPALLTQKFSKVGGGVQFGLNAELVKGFRFVTTNYFSDAGGRYLFGQAPDLVVHADGSLSGVHASGTVDGFEWTVKNTLLYTYYGGIYIGRNAGLDANGTTKIGYGYAGAPNSQNRAINEFTIGFNQTMWKNARYGAFNIMGQYEYLQRNPWAVAVGAPINAHDNTIYMNIRYTLPGSMPNF